MPTERLYYHNARLAEFSATVTAIDGTRVRLDRSAFYPTSGGQQFDTGTLGGVPVTDVVDDGADVTHVLGSAPPFGVGDAVRGVVDRERRFDHMQQHTGQHLLSALFEDICGAPTVSVHFGADSCTLDLDAALSRETAIRVEARANDIVAENRAVTVSFEDAAAVTGLRKPSDRAGEIRVVTIAGMDRSACGGTHVRATGEIGAVLLRKLEKYKQLTRVEFLCGMRAIRHARADYDTLASMAAALTAGIQELPSLVAANAESVRSFAAERKKLVESLAACRARELYASSAPGADGTRRVVARSGSADELRALAHAGAALEKAVFICIGAGAAPTIVLAAAPDAGVSAGALLKPLLTSHGGRGGGNQTIAQGTVPDAHAADAIAAALLV